MKQILKQNIYLIVLITILLSCKNDKIDELIPFEIEKTEIIAPNVGIIEAIKIKAPKKWVASSENAWIKIVPANGYGSEECDIFIDPSVLNESREGKLVISSETGEKRTVRITQFGFDKGIILSTSDTIIESTEKLGKRYTDITITSNVDLSHEIMDISTQEETPAKWIKCSNASDFDTNKTGARPQKIDLRFEWKNNLTPKERSAKITFTSNELESSVKLFIHQKAGAIITDDAKGDSLCLCIVGEKLNMNSKWNDVESIKYWDGVTLWQKTDSIVKQNPEMLDRVRYLTIKSFKTEESIPVEIGNLKYLEKLYIGTNSNKMLLNIDLSKDEDGIGKLENLKELTIFSYGLVGNIPKSWNNLKKLEILDLRGNNFSTIPSMITKANFPSLKILNLSANRRYAMTSLYPIMHPVAEIGLYVQTSSYAFKQLLKWNELEYIGLSNCIIEGTIPTAKELGITSVYSEADFTNKGDTLNYLIGKPKVLPNTTTLRLNLNFLTGDIPEWILHHPKLIYWDPWTLLFKQEVGKKNSKGEDVEFNNIPLNWEYYWEMFPLLKPTRE